MEKNQRYIDTIFIVVLVIINVLLSLFAYTYFKGNTNLTGTSQEDLAVRMGLLEQTFVNVLNNDNRSVLDSLEIQKYDTEFSSLEERLQEDKPLFVLRIADLHCEQCVKFIILKLLRMAKETEMEKHIVIFADFQNRNALSVFLKSMSIKYPVYLVNDIPLDMEKLSFPYCFLLDKGHAIHTFVPDKTQPDIANLYVKTIQERYYKESSQN